MTTNATIIADALRDLNVIAESDSLDSAKGSHGLRKLNDLMAMLIEQDVDLGYFAQTSTSATCPIPAWAEGPIKAALSVILAPTYGAALGAEQVAVVESFVSTLRRKMISERLEGADLSHLPAGAGHVGAGWDINSDT